jgi:hypothetical protein
VATNVIYGNMRGFCEKLKGPGLICKYLLRTKSLNAKFAYMVGLRVNCWNWERAICKKPGFSRNLIYFLIGNFVD